ncbi:hypothetical protein DIPPA_14468 [Diplonema papillatum]|nr:hypothetical protein DIPPA_14468 [Diplonema papillatum]
MDVTFRVPAREITSRMAACVLKKGWVTGRVQANGEWSPRESHPAERFCAVLVGTFPSSTLQLILYKAESDEEPLARGFVDDCKKITTYDGVVVFPVRGSCTKVMLIEAHEWAVALQALPTATAIEPAVISILSKLGLSHRPYDKVLAANGYERLAFLREAEVPDLVAIGVPVGHARAIAKAASRTQPTAAGGRGGLLPELSLSLEGSEYPGDLVSEASSTEPLAVMKEMLTNGQSFTQDTALKFSIYTSKLLECEAQMQKLRSSVRQASSTPSSTESFTFNGRWREDKENSDPADDLLRELDVSSAAREAFKTMEVTYILEHRGNSFSIDEDSKFGENKSSMPLDGTKGCTASGAYVMGSLDPDGALRRITELPGDLGVSTEVWRLIGENELSCQTDLMRDGRIVASMRRLFNRIE